MKYKRTRLIDLISINQEMVEIIFAEDAAIFTKTKLREGNIFTGVSLFTGGVVVVVSLVLCPFQGVGISCTRSLSGVGMSRGSICLGQVSTRDLGYHVYGWPADSIHPTRMLSFTIRFCITR